MKKIKEGALSLVFLGILIFSLSLAWAQACECNSCADCNSKLNNADCKEVKLTADITNFVGTCINNPAGFNNKVFDCQGHKIEGDGIEEGEEVDYGIYLNFKQNNTIKNCRITDFSEGIFLYRSLNISLINNNASSNIFAGISLSHSNYSILINNVLYSNGGYGIYLAFSWSNILMNNSIRLNGDMGFYLYSSYNNTIINNIINLNGYGIGLDYCCSSGNNINKIYNNLFNNTINLWGVYLKNDWNTTKQARTNIVGGPYLGGNFWANPSGTGFSETCTDADKDGICDDAYTLAKNNVDYLPLSTRFNKAPQIILNEPAINAQFNTPNINFNFTVKDDWSTTLSCSIYLDSALNQTNSNVQNNTLTNFLVTGITDGSHNWYINCSDNLGLSSISEIRSFIVSTGPTEGEVTGGAGAGGVGGIEGAPTPPLPPGGDIPPPPLPPSGTSPGSPAAPPTIIIPGPGGVNITVTSPTPICSQSNQDSCCSNAPEYYNASKPIWHNVSIEGNPDALAGYNWSWSGEDNVTSKLSNTSSNWSKVNISHVYGLKNNASNVLVIFKVINSTSGKEAGSGSVLIPLTKCEVFQPIVNITSPQRGNTYIYGQIQHNATVIDYDTELGDINFTWLIISNDFSWVVNKTSCKGSAGCPNMSFLLNYSGNYTSILTAIDNTSLSGTDSLTFRVANDSCKCDGGTLCKSWNIRRESSSTYCNERGQWQNFCLVHAHCKGGEICNASHQCQAQPSFCSGLDSSKGCSAYTDEGNCTTPDPCGFVQTVITPGCDPTLQTCQIVWGCKWNGSACLTNIGFTDPKTGVPAYTCNNHSQGGDCASATGKSIQVTFTFTSDPKGHELECCQPSGGSECQQTNGVATYTTTITCPTLPSQQMPGFGWANVIAVILLLVAYYALCLLSCRGRKRAK